VTRPRGPAGLSYARRAEPGLRGPELPQLRVTLSPRLRVLRGGAGYVLPSSLRLIPFGRFFAA
jgi:hypothetical protein